MNVGEKRRSHLVPVIMNMTRRWRPYVCLLVGDYRGHESLVIRLLHDEEQDCNFLVSGYWRTG